MLDNNNLFRRMEHTNPFRTFSRGYSRRHFASHLKSIPKNSHDTPQQYRTISSQGQFYTDDRHATSNRDFITTYNQSLKSIQTILPHNNFKVLSSNEKFTVPVETNGMDEQTSMFLGGSFNDRKFSSNSMILKLSRQDNFRLKSCQQKQVVNYESLQDESEFSLLQAKKRLISNRNSNRLCKTSNYGSNRQRQSGRRTVINFAKQSQLLSEMVSTFKRKP